MEKVVMDELRKLIVESGLSRVEDRLLELALPSIRFNLNFEEQDLPIGSSKFGGLPDLPKEIVWPNWEELSLTFLAQFNLVELNKFEAAKVLPESGMLYFFILNPVTGLDFSKYPFWKYAKVLYYNGDLTLLEPRFWPENLDEFDRYPTFSLVFREEYNLPDSLSYPIKSLQLTDMEEELYNDKVYNHLFRDQEDKPFHRLLGYPNPIEPDILPDKGERLLFQMDSEENYSDLWWGDMGMLYFMINEQDLHLANFNNARVEILSC